MSCFYGGTVSYICITKALFYKLPFQSHVYFNLFPLSKFLYLIRWVVPGKKYTNKEIVLRQKKNK